MSLTDLFSFFPRFFAARKEDKNQTTCWVTVEKEEWPIALFKPEIEQFSRFLNSSECSTEVLLDGSAVIRSQLGFIIATIRVGEEWGAPAYIQIEYFSDAISTEGEIALRSQPRIRARKIPILI